MPSTSVAHVYAFIDGQIIDPATGNASALAGRVKFAILIEKWVPVWLNPGSKTYHIKGSRWYAKTNNGDYVSEERAIAKGFRRCRYSLQNEVTAG